MAGPDADSSDHPTDDFAPGSGATARVQAVVSGHVQGVGFRWWTRCRALELGLVGSATNRDDGTVAVVAEGAVEGLRALIDLLSAQPAPPVPQNAARSYYRRPGLVSSVSVDWSPSRGGLAGFVEA